MSLKHICITYNPTLKLSRTNKAQSKTHDSIKEMAYKTCKYKKPILLY